MSKLTRYKVVNLPYPGRVNLFGFGDVDLHKITDKQADAIHAAGAAKKNLIPVAELTTPAEKPQTQSRRRRNQQLS